MPNYRADIAVIQATPAGIAAAVAAGRLGSSVILVESSAHVGGMMANGLCVTDLTTRESVGGIFNEFAQRVHRHYLDTYGAGSAEERLCNRGLVYEPHVGERVLEGLLRDARGATLLMRHQLVEAITQAGTVVAVIVADAATGERSRIDADVFIDATYEGDLAALVGAEYVIGRESRAETAEPYAGVIYMDYETKRVYRGSTGDGSDGVQAYTYRLCLTRRPELRRAIPRPADYRRTDYASIIPEVRSGALRRLAGTAFQRDVIIHAEPLPNGKHDANNHHNSLISTDLPEENREYPEGDANARARFAARLASYVLGLIWFCQNDPELPEAFRLDAQQWGLASDEFTDNANFPRQIYVREARRIVGMQSFSAHDATLAPGAERTPHHWNAVCSAHYMIDSHAFRKREDVGEFRHRQTLDGFLGLNFVTHPYQAPYGVMVPRRVHGLLVPVAVSATHLGFCTLRMEPCWMSLGQAAGTAAHLARHSRVDPRDVSIPVLQRQLIKDGAVLCYFDDVSRAHPHWQGVQFLGVRGMFSSYLARTNRPVSRAEAARWIVAVVPERPSGDLALTFRDLREENPATNSIVYLASHGIFADDEPQDEFRPGEALTWRELDQWLHRGLGVRLASLTVRPAPDAPPYLRRGELAQALFEAMAAFEGMPARA